MRVALCSTAKSLSEAYKGHRTLEAVRQYYGITTSKGTLSRILRGAEGVSWQAEQEVRRALGMGKRKHYHRPCLDDATYAAWLAFRAGAVCATCGTPWGWRPTCDCPGRDGDSPWPDVTMHPDGAANWPAVSAAEGEEQP